MPGGLRARGCAAVTRGDVRRERWLGARARGRRCALPGGSARSAAGVRGDSSVRQLGVGRDTAGLPALPDGVRAERVCAGAERCLPRQHGRRHGRQHQVWRDAASGPLPQLRCHRPVRALRLGRAPGRVSGLPERLRFGRVRAEPAGSVPGQRRLRADGSGRRAELHGAASSREASVPADGSLRRLGVGDVAAAVQLAGGRLPAVLHGVRALGCGPAEEGGLRPHVCGGECDADDCRGR